MHEAGWLRCLFFYYKFLIITFMLVLLSSLAGGGVIYCDSLISYLVWGWWCEYCSKLRLFWPLLYVLCRVLLQRPESVIMYRVIASIVQLILLSVFLIFSILIILLLQVMEPSRQVTVKRNPLHIYIWIFKHCPNEQLIWLGKKPRLLVSILYKTMNFISF